MSLDALTQKVREAGRIVNVAVVITVGVNADGHATQPPPAYAVVACVAGG